MSWVTSPARSTGSVPPADSGLVLPGGAPSLFGPIVEQLGAAKLLREGPGRGREAVRPRPGLGPRAGRPAAPAAAREPDPAGRPLPRQGAGHRAGVPAVRHS